MAASASSSAPEEEKRILVTGGAGYIGSHTVLQLLKEGFLVSIIDNLDNSCEEAVERVRDLAGPNLSQNLQFYLGDLRNKEDLERVFSQSRYDAVIHFAGLKAVGESVAKPLLYYNNNLIGTINLYEFMSKYGCNKMVFSSSTTVYGQPEKIPCVEDFELKAMNPYGRTKLFLEEIARDLQRADPDLRVVLLRYFNPVGAHESGKIGEDPKGIPNNLMPYIQQVAVGRLPVLNVYGHDYPTKDGTPHEYLSTNCTREMLAFAAWPTNHLLEFYFKDVSSRSKHQKSKTHQGSVPVDQHYSKESVAYYFAGKEEQVELQVYGFVGDGVALAIYNTDESIRAFAKASINTAYQKKVAYLS